MRRPVSLRQAGAVIAAAGLGLFGLAATPAGASAGAAASPRSSAPPAAQRPISVSHTLKLPAGTRQACASPARLGQMQCQSVVRSAEQAVSGAGTSVTVTGSYGPRSLQKAYGLVTASGSLGTGETVAVVDAYDDPNAEKDLGTYRNHYQTYGLNPCTTANGCFKKVNQYGNASSMPPVDSTGGWEFEEALDLDMVSAVCPNCNILLVEANSNSITDLGAAENTAVSMGAKFVSNSWSGFDWPGESAFEDVYFNHPGVAITAASGDFGYGTGDPAASQFVTSVGGTYLTNTSNNSNCTSSRGWCEKVWNNQYGATGSGCSAGGAKPAWQHDTGCKNRTENDVSAVADGPAGVAVYDSYPIPGYSPGWFGGLGTSVATPVIASVYALAGTPAAATYPSSYLYQTGHATHLYDVKRGSDGTCESSRPYVCTAETGYDGPTGFGTPHGISAFKNTATGNLISVANPGTQDYEVGSQLSLQLQATDSAGQALTYAAAGLPAGLSIDSATGVISGTLPTAAGSSTVTVTATDPTTASGSVAFKIVRVPSLVTGFHPVAGPVHLKLGGMCLDDSQNSSADGTKVDIWTCNGSAAQNWTYTPNGDPGGAGVLTIHGKCMEVINSGTANGSKIDISSCTGGGNQQWYIVGFDGLLYNPQSQKCLDDPGKSTTNGTQVDIRTCRGGSSQAWTLPASPIQVGIAGKCLDDTGNSSANGTKIELWTCNGHSSQKWTIGLNGSLRIHGKCIDVPKHSKLDGARLILYTCNTNVKTNMNQLWFLGIYGQLENFNSEKCLADPGNSTTDGTWLIQWDCYSPAGQIWAVS